MTTLNYLQPDEFTRIRNEWPSGTTLLDRISFYSSPPTKEGCIEWRGPYSSNGRPSLKLGSKSVVVARLVWIYHRGEIPPGQIIRHVRCANKRCINIDHLAVGTHFDNAKDRDTDGRTARGSSHYRSLLTEEQVLDILSWRESHKAAAERYGVGKSTVVNIRRGNSWKHLTSSKLERGV